MAAKQTDIKVKVDFDANLKQLEEASKKVQLTDKQRESFNRSVKGAQMGLQGGSMKNYDRNFMSAVNTLQKAIVANNQIDKKLTEVNEKIQKNQERERELANKRTITQARYVEDANKKPSLTKAGAKAYLANFNAEQGRAIKGAGGHELGYETIIKNLDKVSEKLKTLFGDNASMSKVTDKMAQEAGFGSRQDVFAANSLKKGLDSAALAAQKEDLAVKAEQQLNTTEGQNLQTELNNLQTGSVNAASSMQQLYTELSKLAGLTHAGSLPQIKQENSDAAAAAGGGKADTGSSTIPEKGIGKAIKSITLYRVALRAVKKLAREVISTISQLDKSLNEQAMVTGMTRKETYQLLGTYQNLAKATGSTTKEVAEVTTQFVRQGKTISEALTLTEAAVSAAKVASIDVSSSVNYLTTALNGFQMSAEDAMLVSDKFAAVAAQSATSYEEIATALSKVASQANLAGMSMDYTIALLSKGIETTREAPETIGTALKTVIARMREISDYGETLEDGMDLNNVETQLGYVDIALRTSTGELRSTEDVLDDLGKKWDTLNSNQQAAIAKALAGTRQQSRLIAMMTDYERVTELQQISARSAGATSAQAATYLEGMEAAINNIKVAIEEITTGLTNSDFIIGIMNAIADTLSLIADNIWIIYTVGGLILTLSIANLALTIKKKNMEDGITLKKSFQYILEKLTLGLKKAEVVEGTKLVALQKASLGIIGIILTVITAIVVAVVALVKSSKDINEKFADINAEIYELNEEINAIDAGLDTFDKLNDKLIQTAEDAEAAKEALHGIADEFPDETGKNVKKEFLAENEIDEDSKLYDMLENWDSSEQGLQSYLKTLDDDQKEEFYRLMEENDERVLANKRRDAMNDPAMWAEYNKLRDDESRQAYLDQHTDMASTIATVAKANVYDQIDNNAKNQKLTDDQKTAVENFTTGIIDEMSDIAKIDIAKDSSQAQNLIDVFSSLYTVTDEEGERATVTLAEALTSDATTLSEAITIYNDALSKLTGDEQEAFAYKFQHLADFQEQLTPSALALADAYNISADAIDTFQQSYTALNKLMTVGGHTFTSDEWSSITKDVLNQLGENEMDVAEVVSQYTKAYDFNSEQQEKFIELIHDMVTEPLSQTTDDITSLESVIDGYYEKASKFNEMTTSEKQELASSLGMTDELYEAIASGDYSKIREAISSSEELEKTRQELLATLDTQIKIQESLAASGDENAKTELKLLKQKKAQLEDIVTLYSVSYEELYEREKDQLDAYKELLEEETDATKEALEDRKEAYEKYFDAINEAAEDADYYEEVENLTNAMTALSSSNTGEARTKMGELESQLKDLNEERIETLRERAQDAILEDIDDQINNIEENVEELTKSNQELLMAMTQDMKNPTEFMGRLMANSIVNGATGAELQNNIASWQSTYGGLLSEAQWTKLQQVAGSLSFEKDSNNNIVINIDGHKEIISDTNTTALGNAIIDALATAGISV